jgi:H+-translocating diphosphatase
MRGRLEDSHTSHSFSLSKLLKSFHNNSSSCSMFLYKLLFFLIPSLLIYLYTQILSSFNLKIIMISLTIALSAIILSLYLLMDILIKDKGSHTMQEISQPIKEGSEGFFKTQYGTMLKIAFAVTILLFGVYMLKSDDKNELSGFISKNWMAFMTGVSFMLGSLCSAFAGYAGIWVSVRANVRVASAARKCYNEALVICFRGGAFSVIINVALAIFGICVLYLSTYLIIFIKADESKRIPVEKIPLILVGFGFGASFVAMFAQLGGGIYTKGADVGADLIGIFWRVFSDLCFLIGKQDVGIPEDDPRNPAVIADLIGDNVGDCAGNYFSIWKFDLMRLNALFVGQCADLFESISAEVISAMILGGTLGEKANLPENLRIGYMLFPLAVHCLDLIVSSIGIFFTRTKEGLPEYKPDYGQLEDPLTVMKRGYIISVVLN